MNDALPQQSFLSATEQTKMMGGAGRGTLFQPLLRQPGTPRQQLRCAPYQLPLTASMGGVTESQGVREPPARGDDSDALG